MGNNGHSFAGQTRQTLPRRVLDYIAEHQGCGLFEISEALDADPGKVIKALQRLESQRKIRQRRTYWRNDE